MVFNWNNWIKEFNFTERGRIKLLEWMINYGPGKERFKLSEVKKYWEKLKLRSAPKALMELLIWGKYITPHKRNHMSLQQILGMDRDEYFAFCIINGPDKVMKLRLLLEE